MTNVTVVVIDNDHNTAAFHDVTSSLTDRDDVISEALYNIASSAIFTAKGVPEDDMEDFVEKVEVYCDRLLKNATAVSGEQTIATNGRYTIVFTIDRLK